MENWLAFSAIVAFAIFNLVVVVLVARASAPPRKRPEEEMAAFLEESMAFARTLRGPDEQQSAGPTSPGAGAGSGLSDPRTGEKAGESG